MNKGFWELFLAIIGINCKVEESFEEETVQIYSLEDYQNCNNLNFDQPGEASYC